MKRNVKDIVRYFVEDSQTFSKLNLNVSKKELDITTKLHWHDFFEIEFILKGKAVHHLNDATGIIETGNVCVLTPIDFHQIETIEPLEIINITFKDSWIPTELIPLFMSTRQFINIHFSGEKFEYIKLLANRLLEEFSQNKEYRVFYMQSLLNCIFSEIAYASPISIENQDEYKSDIIKHVLIYLYGNFRSNPDLHSIAKLTGLCDNYFCEVFRKATGQTYNRFLNNLKLQYAHDVLIHSNKSITDVCFSSGFNSMTHFQREFKNKYRLTPSEIRKIKPNVQNEQ